MDLFKADHWLSSLLGKPAYHLIAPPTGLTAQDLFKTPAFIDAKVSVEDAKGLIKLQSLGFLVIDTNIQLVRPALDMSFGHTHGHTQVRFAQPDDATSVKDIARTTFEHNRFHRDLHIPTVTASYLKEAWAGNFFTGKRGEWMIVAEVDCRIVGFLQLLRSVDDSVVIDLIAVAKSYQRQGLARAMITYANSACLNRAAILKVGTQISNASSLAFYTKLGFQIKSATYMLHWHQQG